jgi:putative FmdB family regulatory protein
VPVYEFLCLRCQRRFERYVRSFGEAVTCPGCSGSRVEKQLSTFALAGAQPASREGGGGGGCCGGGCCGCH